MQNEYAMAICKLKEKEQSTWGEKSTNKQKISHTYQTITNG